MSEIDLQVARENAPNWTDDQFMHLDRLLQQKAVIAYWFSDAQGRPANHIQNDYKDRQKWTVKPGMVQTLSGKLVPCSNALHGTIDNMGWSGSRVWMIGFLGEVIETAGKICGLHREIIGEIMPEQCFNPRMGVKLGRKDLSFADLSNANLHGAKLIGADLHGANLSGADLSGADLYGAKLIGADLVGANLHRADLSSADLPGADLYGAYLPGANLYGTDLSGADLSCANLHGAKLAGANLTGTKLTGAKLNGADLTDVIGYVCKK